LKCISVPPYAQRYEGSGTMLEVRDPILYEITTRFANAVDEERYKPDEWARFIREQTEFDSSFA
jgi:hypothetical protein